MNHFDKELKVKDALPIYFSRYHFENGGYHLKWFKIKVGPFFLPMPNIKMRVDAVKIHDIHHLVTEYEADMKGEVEIGGWEIASGCGRYGVAWFLNFGSFLYGMIFHQRLLLRAFLKGRRSATNLYYNTTYDETLLNTTIGELRKKIQPDHVTKNSTFDYFLFASCCVVSLFPLTAFILFCYALATFLF